MHINKMRKIKIYKYCLYTVVYTHTRRAYTFHSLEYRLYGGMSVDLFLHLVVTRFFLVCCYFVLNFVQLPPHACVRLPSVRARWFECCRSIPIKFFAVRSFVFFFVFRFDLRKERAPMLIALSNELNVVGPMLKELLTKKTSGNGCGK